LIITHDSSNTIASRCIEQICVQPCPAVCCFITLLCITVLFYCSLIYQHVVPTQAMTQTFSKGNPFKRPAVWEQPDILRQFQDHVLETTKNAFSLEDTKRHVAHNSSYVSFMRKGRTAKEQADATRNETDDNVNLGMHPYRYGNRMPAMSIWNWIMIIII